MSHLLIVDDDSDVLRLMQNALLAAGLEAEGADHGQAALDLLKLHQFDLLICDILMPNVNGLSVIDFAISTYPNIKILAISGGGANQDGGDLLDAALDCGADAILEKPFHPGELVRTAKALIR